MASAEEVNEAFDELEEIRDRELRNKVVEAWVEALKHSAFDDINEIPRGSTEIKAKYGISGSPEEERNEHLVPHTRDVTLGAIALHQVVDERLNLGADRDVVIAGALLHDISKCYEYDSSRDEFKKWFPHPVYGIVPLEKVGLPLHVQHIVVSHSLLDEIDPQTIEAEIVHTADHIVHQSVNWAEAQQLDPRV